MIIIMMMIIIIIIIIKDNKKKSKASDVFRKRYSRILAEKLANLKIAWLALSPAEKYQFSSPYYKI